MSNLVGQSIGRYTILEPLGEGGMATVYKAYDTRLEREVALKVIRTDQFAPSLLDQILKRFEREAKALARLTHPNIVPVIDYGDHEGVPFLVMPYLPGGTLKMKLGTPMPWQEAVRILQPIAQALAYAHEHNIIHRDIKPSNILLTEKGQPMLSDFGIAKILESDMGGSLTTTGMGVGTPEYMAPEQWTGGAGPLSDLYSLGVVLYELVTGRKPYTADTPAAIMLKQASDPLPPPHFFNPDLPDGLERLLYKALARNPEDRYANMAAMVQAFDNLLSGQSQPAPAVTSPSMPKPHLASPQATILGEGSQTFSVPAPHPGMAPQQPAYQPAAPATQTPPPVPYAPSSPKRRHWIPFAVIGGVLVLALVACLAVILGGGLLSLTQKTQNTPTIPPAPTATVKPTSTLKPTVVNTPTLAGVRYENAAAGIRLMIPSGWQASEASSSIVANAEIYVDSPNYQVDSSGYLISGATVTIFVPVHENFPFSLNADSMPAVVNYYGTGGGDTLFPGESIHTFTLSGYPAASGAFGRAFDGQLKYVMDLVPVLVNNQVILIEALALPEEWAQQKPILESIINSITITPTPLLTLVPGMAGRWLDPDTTGTVTSIEMQGDGYVVVSVINPNRGGNELTKTNWSNGVLTWTYCIPNGNCITSVTTGIEGDSLYTTWTDDRGYSGETTFERQP